jgi:S1-C subfamily serine protease
MMQEIPARWAAAERAAAQATQARRPGRKVLPGCAVTLTAAVTLVAGLAGCANPGTAATAAGSGTGQATTADALVSAIRRVLPSVVEIRTRSGLGSGVVFDSDGDIVTNAHVIGDGSGLEVLRSGSAEPVPASLLGIDRQDDPAVIRVSGATGLRPAVFGDSAKLVAGDIVLAIGNPLGLSGSVTEGIVSAVGRVVDEPVTPGSPGATLNGAIQTSAAINPGNSGGALATVDGEVVGIPTLAAMSKAAGGAAPGIGFAISSNTVVRIARELVADGYVTNP